MPPLHLQARLRAATPTPHFQLHSDGTAAGDQAVANMQAVCEADYQAAKAIFGREGDIPGLPFVVLVDPSAGGAWHQTCADTGIHLIPDDAPSLLVAETTECFMAEAPGWDCGATNGEGLSRALAMTIRPFQVLEGLDGDVQGWWASGTDFVNDNSATDQDQQANACGTLFLFWLHGQLGFSWQQIVAAGGANLGETYAKLTGHDGAQGFQNFISDLRQLDQGGQLQVPASGNPFPVGQPAPAPGPGPTPAPVPPPPPPPLDKEPAWWEKLERHYPGLTEWLEQHFGLPT